MKCGEDLLVAFICRVVDRTSYNSPIILRGRAPQVVCVSPVLDCSSSAFKPPLPSNWPGAGAQGSLALAAADVAVDNPGPQTVEYSKRVEVAAARPTASL
jgi:hypothetical protein